MKYGCVVCAQTTEYMTNEYISHSAHPGSNIFTNIGLPKSLIIVANVRLNFITSKCDACNRFVS